MANTTGRKFGGRKVGTPNRITVELRYWLTMFLEARVAQIESDWNKLKPAQRVAYFERLLKICLPPPSGEQISSTFDNLSDEDLHSIIHKLHQIGRNEQNGNDCGT